MCQWQSQILNNSKFSEEVNISNNLEISEQIKQDYDDVNSIENEDESENLVSIGIKPKTKRVKSSAVHDHFDKIKIIHPTTKKTSDGSICKHCKAKLSNRISTNLKNHLKCKHPEVFDEVQSKQILIMLSSLGPGPGLISVRSQKSHQHLNFNVLIPKERLKGPELTLKYGCSIHPPTMIDMRHFHVYQLLGMQLWLKYRHSFATSTRPNNMN